MFETGFSNYEVSNALGELDDIFMEWCVCFNRLCDTSRTVPHQSKPEETNVGIFAGAAWRKNWVVFQEMSRLKMGLEGYGYCDLWIRRDHASQAYYFESKGNKTRSKEDAQYNFELAIRDTKRLITEEREAIKVALAFSNIQFKKNGSINIDDEIERIVSEIVQIPNDALAYCFPMSVRDYNDGAYIYPGVILLAKIVDE